MSFYVYGTDEQTQRSLDTIVTLAVEGNIAAALQKWRVHQNARDLCVCGRREFDPVCCGFCFTGKLLYLELLHSGHLRGVDYLETARAVSAFVAQHSATKSAGAKFYQLDSRAEEAVDSAPELIGLAACEAGCCT